MLEKPYDHNWNNEGNLLCPCKDSLRRPFPQESNTFRSSLVSIQTMFKTSLSFMFFIWRKFATLLPNNWLAETLQALALMRLGRLSAERERIP